MNECDEVFVCGQVMNIHEVMYLGFEDVEFIEIVF